MRLADTLRTTLSDELATNLAELVDGKGTLTVKELHYAVMVDYYSIAKLKRFDRTTQQLFLPCYLQEWAQINIERLADGFIYHVRKLAEKAKVYAKELAYKYWEGAVANISKVAELL